MKTLNDYPGLAVYYDAKKEPFFEAIVRENLNKIASLKTGEMLLNLLATAKPGATQLVGATLPKGVNVVISPPENKAMIAPGLAKRYGTALVIRDHQAWLNWDHRCQGGLICGMSGKAAGHPHPMLKQEDAQRAYEKDDGKPNDGAVSELIFSNIEIKSKTGDWLHPFLVMGHELIHCLHFVNGVGKNAVKQEEYHTVGIKGFEKYLVTENKLRTEAHVAVREKYFPDD